MAGEHEETAHQELSATDAEAAEATQEAGKRGRRAPWRRNPFLFGACVLLVAAIAAAGVFGGLWASASLGGDAHYSQVRNRVLQVAKGAAINFTSVDYRHLDQYKKHAEESTTGTLHKTLDKSIGNYTDKLAKAKLVVHGSVMQAALSTLDTHTGNASALVVVKTVTTRDGQKPSTRRLPMTLKLTKGDSGQWKVSGLGGSGGSSALPGK